MLLQLLFRNDIVSTSVKLYFRAYTKMQELRMMQNVF